jgi:hypothetical protein
MLAHRGDILNGRDKNVPTNNSTCWYKKFSGMIIDAKIFI